MKQKSFSILLALLMSMAANVAMAYDAEIDGIYYNFSGTEAIVTNCDNNNYSGDIIIPQSVTYKGKTYEVTNIDDRAFMSCLCLTSVNIPESVTNIGSEAFLSCNQLTSINIPNSVTRIGSYAFRSCFSLTSINIPESVISIERGAFWDCYSLTFINIPQTVTSVGDRAFEGTSWFSNQPDGLVYVGKVAYKYKGSMPENTAINITDGTVSISPYAFDGCTNLTAITIPESVTSIGSSAFSGTAWYENQSDGVVYLGKIAYKYKGTMPENTTIDIKENTLMINDAAFGGCSGLTSISIPEGLTVIGQSAFSGCRSLTSIIIPESVTTIGPGAFGSCQSLRSIIIPNGVTCIEPQTFVNCDKLSSVTLPENLTSIGSQAFYQCTSLHFITIPEGVISIGNGAFDSSGLQSITIPKSVTNIDYQSSINFNGLSRIIVEEGNTKYDSRDECNAIIETASNTLILGCKNTIIPGGVTNIGNGAFSYCSGLRSITIPKSVTKIDFNAFFHCNGLTSIIVEDGNMVYDSRNNCNAIIETASNTLLVGCNNTLIPKGVIHIGHGAFYECRGLASVSIPEGVTSIDYEAFCYCSSLTSIDIAESITNIGSRAFAGTAWYDHQPNGLVYAGKVAYKYKGSMPDNTKIDIKDGTLGIAEGAFSNYTALTSINIPKSVTKIGSSAFYGCSGLASINIPESVSEIGNSTFFGCRGLTSIKLPENMTEIGLSAFYDCSGLTSLKIPQKVTKIGSSAFYGCSGLTSIIIPESVTEIGKSAFDTRSSAIAAVKVGMKTPISINEYTFQSSYGNATLYVPFGCKAVYEASYPWSRFTNIVECNYVDMEKQILVADHSATIEIGVNNFDSNIVAFQMDLTLPEGVGIDKTGCTLSSRITDEEQTLTIGKLESGAYRLTSTSLSLTPISGNDGTLLTLKLTAEDGCAGGQATISNIIFSTSESEKIVMNDESFDINILYKVAYKVDGEEYQTDRFVYNTAVTPLENLTKEGYTFSGWSEIPEIMPAHDVEVTGSFSINYYTLTYTLDGEEYKTSTIAYGTAITAEDELSKEGYTFSGWSEIPETMPAHDVEVTGSFSINYYTLTYKVDGEEYKTSNVAYGTEITAEEELAKEGYTFSGWSEIPQMMPAHDVEITGSFSINSYVLTYLLNDEEYKTSTIVYGTELTPEAEPTEKEGYAFSGWSEIPETMPAHDVVVTGNFYPFGDVNADEEVDVVDVVDIARFVVATPSDNFIEKLADINKDNTVNISDAVALVNYIAGDQNFVKAMIPSSQSYDYSQCQLQLLSTGQDALSLCLNGDADFTAFQFEVDVPEGLDISAMCINSSRKDGHQLLYNKVADNRYRVAALSLTNATFRGREGELLQISINGQPADEICIHDIHFVTTNGTDITFDGLALSGPATGIVNTNVNEGNDVIYDLQGRKLSKVQRGVNIVNGKKVLVNK